MLGTEHYIYRPDGRIYVYKVGREVYVDGPASRQHGLPTSGEPVVFLHPMGASGQVWEAVVDLMAERFVCYVVDSPGHGHSDVPPQKYWIEDYTQAVLDVLDGLRLSQASFIGDHTGAMIALELAVKRPERVKRLVLDGLPYWNQERGQIIWQKFYLPQYTDESAYHVPVAPLVAGEEAEAGSELTDQTREVFEEARQKDRLWHRYSQEANTSYDTEAAGPRVKTPTLLIYGEGDVLRRGEERAHRDIEGSVLKVVPGASGAAHREKPQEFARLATAFLQQKLNT